jgi:hypothetical protein
LRMTAFYMNPGSGSSATPRPLDPRQNRFRGNLPFPRPLTLHLLTPKPAPHADPQSDNSPPLSAA